MKKFIEVVYQRELNNFTVRKIKALNFDPGHVDMIENGLEKLINKHKIYSVYGECSANFDRINEVLNTLAGSKKSNLSTQKLSLHPPEKIQLEKSKGGLQDGHNFLLLKNILKQAYLKSKDFKLSLQAASFRTLVAAFLYLYENIDKDDLLKSQTSIAATGQPPSPIEFTPN